MSDTAQAVVRALEKAPAATAVKARRLHVILAFLAIYLIWGSTYLAIRYAVETIPSLYTAGLRHLVAGSILLLWALAKKIRPTAAQLRASIVIGFFFFLVVCAERSNTKTSASAKHSISATADATRASREDCVRRELARFSGGSVRIFAE